MFIGRARELAWLGKTYERRASALVPIYGRRRVGKTELIRRFIEDRPAVFHMGKVAPAHAQIREFLIQLSRTIHDPLIADLPADSWRRALEAVERFNPQKKLVVVLDEFQWTTQSSPELPSLLQELWDLRWRDSNRIFLILCGSYVGFMERAVLGHKSPLFGRRTGQLFLQPFPYYEAAAFHPHWSLEDRARAYFVCGGIPAYLRRFDDNCSFEMNVRDHVLEPTAAMYREPEFLLREELREVERYFAVLLAIATGAATMKEVSQRSRIDERALYYYVQQLVELGYVERRQPLRERGAPATRRTRLRLRDPLLRFWFRFVFGDQSYLAEVGASAFFRTVVRPNLSAYFGNCFEALCREALPVLYATQRVDAPFEVGEYWDKQVQIDVVGLRDDNWTDLGECKWGTVRAAHVFARELGSKARQFPNQRGATVVLHAFVRKAPRSAANKAIRWHDLDELYAAAKSRRLE